MPDEVKASLVADEDDMKTRRELEGYQERERARRRRAAVIRAVKEDLQNRPSMPNVSKSTRYDLGPDGRIPAIVEPRDDDGIVKVSLDTTGDGEIDAVLCFDKRKKLRDIKDLHSNEEEEERREEEEERQVKVQERQTESEREDAAMQDMLEGKGHRGGLSQGILGMGDEDKRDDGRRDESRRDDKKDDDYYAKSDADTYAKMQPIGFLMGKDRAPKKRNPAAVKSVDVTYAKRPRRGRRRNRYPGAMLR